MKKRINIFPIFILLFITTSSFGQVIWPVHLTKTSTLISPRSLDLNVYRSERRSEITFQAMFNDPVRPTLEVTPQVTIIREGQVIYQTDPNYFGPTIILNQSQTLSIDGGDLQAYLRPEALTGADNSGMGSLLVPQGNVEICLELIGSERRIPVSGRVCHRGRFELNQVPQPVRPECNKTMEFPETQNLIFNWNIMHRGGQNNPSPVEYRFELVQMPLGTTNVNDAFNSALKIYETTSMAPTILYSQSEPRLKPNVLYAWRVQASSAIFKTSLLFENDGYSEVCSFMYLDAEGDQPGGGLGTGTGISTSTIINETDKPAPSGCNVFTTDFGPVVGDASQTMRITEEEVVKLGYFEMEITQAVQSSSGYNGMGKVKFPMFKSLVNVEFKGLRVNQNFRVFDADYIKAKIDRSFKLSDDELKSTVIAESINNTYVTELDQFFTTGQGKNRLVSGFNLANPVAVDLPIGIDTKSGPMVAVIGLRFTPRNALINLASWKDEGGTEVMRFAATNIESTPFGLKTNAHLVPIGGDAGNKNIAGAFNVGFTRSGSSKMNVSCTGFVDLNLTPHIVISKDLMSEEGSGDEIILRPSTPTSSPDTYIGELRTLPDLVVSSLPDFVFKPGKTYMDLSATEALQNPPAIAGFQLPTQSNWRGLVMDDVTVELPKEYDFTGSGRKVSVPGGQIVLNDQEIEYGNVTQQNVVTLAQGQMGSWAYSVDNFEIKILNGTTSGANLTGKMKVPVFKELFDYSGALNANETGQILMNVGVPNTPLTMDIWKAQLIPDDQNSSISAKLADDGTGKRQFFPSAKFDGAFSMNFSDTEFSNAVLGDSKEQTIADIKSGFGISTLDFTIDGVNLKEFELQPFSPAAEKYTLSEANLDGANVTLGGTAVTLNNFELVAQITDTERVGWKTIISNGNNKVELIFWALSSANGFAFEGIEAKVIKIQCNCISLSHNGLEPTSEGAWGIIIDEVIDQHYSYLFEETVPTGSLAAYGINEKSEGWQTVLKNILRQKLRKNTIGGFPMTEEGEIVIPFLDAQKLALDDNNIGVLASDFTNRDNYTFSNLDYKAGNSAQQNMLPFDITNSLDKLGLVGKGIPTDARFLITGFRPTNVDGASWQQSVMDLTIVYQINEETHLLFSKNDIPVTTSSVNFSNLFMSLEKAVPLDNLVTFLPGSGTKDEANGSYTSITCEKGFELFNVQAVYTAPFGENATKIKTIADDKTISPTKFDFTVNSPSSLKTFIAPVKPTSNGKQWSFVADGAEQLVYRPGQNFKAFLDYDAGRVVENATAVGESNSPPFKGLVFENLEVELLGMKAAPDQPLKFEVKDIVFKNEKGISTPKIEKTNLVTKNSNATLSDWKYEIEAFSYEMKDGKLTPEVWRGDKYESGGVHLKGKLQIPAFEDLDNKPELKNLGYTSGWMPFDGTVGVNKNGTVYEPVAALKAAPASTDKYLLKAAPGMSVSPNNEGAISSLSWAFDATKNEFAPSAELNGKAGIEINRTVIDAYKNIDAAATGLAGVDLNVQDLKFEKMTISSIGVNQFNIGQWGVASDLNRIAVPTGTATFQSFPTTVSAPIFKVEGNTTIMELPTSIQLANDENQPESAAQTSGLNSSGNLKLVVSQTGEGTKVDDFSMNDFTVNSQLGPVKMEGKLEVSSNAATAGLQTMVETELQNELYTVPLQIAVSDGGTRSAMLNYATLPAPPIVDGQKVMSVGVGVTEEVFAANIPGITATNLDEGGISILTVPADAANPTSADNSVPDDKEAPAAPTNIEATVAKDGLVSLSWKRSTSTDVKGYWVYYANSPEDEFVKLNPTLLSENTFEYQIEAVSLNPFIYYTLRSEDGAYNISPTTDILEVTRPDNIAPLKPFLTEVEEKSAGLIVKWTPSASSDVVNQKLFRRVVSSGFDQEWTEVTTLEPGEDQYLDVFAKIDMELQYRLSAIDAAGNESDFSNTKSNKIGFPSAEAVVTSFRIGRKRTTVYPKGTRGVPAAAENQSQSERDLARQAQAELRQLDRQIAKQERDYNRVNRAYKNANRRYQLAKNKYKNYRKRSKRYRQRDLLRRYKLDRRTLKRGSRSARKMSRSSYKRYQQLSKRRRKYKSRSASSRSVRRAKSRRNSASRRLSRERNELRQLQNAKAAFEPQKLNVPDLRWSFNPRNNELATTPYSYEIWRSSGNKPVELLEKVSSTQNRYTDEKVEPNVLYNYSIRVLYTNGWQGEISPVKTFRVRAERKRRRSRRYRR